jgi:HK97 family phage prohead protease
MNDENDENDATKTERKPTRRQRGEVRARFDQEVELRQSEGDGDSSAVMEGYLAVFDEWTEIDSVFEGRFMERIAPGAFTKTLQERTPKVLFQHGHDPTIGDKPLGVPRTIEARKTGEFFSVELFDETSYVRDLIPAIAAGQYGVSFRFQAVKELFEDEPGRSDSNPDGLPERTVLEASLPEFGPVTFPAYEGATVGMRSVFTEEDFIRSERGLIVPARDEDRDEEDTPPEPAPARHSGEAVSKSRDHLGRSGERPPWAL